MERTHGIALRALLLAAVIALTYSTKIETVTSQTSVGSAQASKGRSVSSCTVCVINSRKMYLELWTRCALLTSRTSNWQAPMASRLRNLEEQLDARGLGAISAHFSYEQCRDHIEDVVREAKLFGLEYAGCAWIPHKDPFDEKTCRDAAAVFNRAGEALAKHGIKFFYHTHGYEFLPYGNGTLFDLLMSETKPEYVRFQMDVYWVVHPGQDPVKLLEKYGKRFELMHVKDMKRGTPGGFTGHSDVTNNVVLGQGVIHWPSIFRAAKKAGVKWYFIEDESPTSVTQIPQSLNYLEKLRF